MSLIIYLLISKRVSADTNAIMDKWMPEDNNLEVVIFKTAMEYKATVVWFDET